MVPEAPSTVHIFCTGASRGEEARDRTKWLIKCTPQCYGPTGCLMELAHGDALERPARLSMAGRHVSLLLSLSPVQRLAASLLRVKGPAGPAATEAFRDLQTTPADSHLQQPHPACVYRTVYCYGYSNPGPLSVWKVSRLVAIRGRYWQFYCNGCGSQDSARASWEWTRWRRMTQLRYAVLSHLAPWECRIGFFQPSWGHLTASFCYITTGTPCALGPLTW